MAHLSTHVLDMARGRPAAGLAVQLHAVRGGQRQSLKRGITDADGRLGRVELPAGVYELIFEAGHYFRESGQELPDPPFLDEVVIRFGVADPEGHYHVPLLLSPYGYSTYRGS